MSAHRRTRSRTSIAIALLTSVVATTLGPPVAAQVQNVTKGTDHATIADAMCGADNGDELVCAPGTYLEQVTFDCFFQAKQVHLRSSGGPFVTTIQSPAGAAGATVYCAIGCGASTLEGFTIARTDLGGASNAIAIEAGSGLTVVDCIIEDIEAPLGAVWAGVNSMFIRCTFRDNIAFAPSIGGHGGAVWAERNAVFIDCVFEDNFALSSGSNGGFGGAVWVDGSSQFADPVFDGCTFRGNFASEGGGAIYVDGTGAGAAPRIEDCLFESNSSATSPGSGGAVTMIDADPRIVGSTFRLNVGWEGGALHWRTTDGNMVAVASWCIFEGNQARRGGAVAWTGVDIASAGIYNSRFVGNSADDGMGGGDGGALWCGGEASSPLFVYGSELSGNFARRWGGGAAADGGLRIFESTVVSNDSGAGASPPCAGIYASPTSELVAFSDIIRNNGDASGENLVVAAGASSFVEYCNIESDLGGPWPGPGNIDLPAGLVDPLGVDGMAGTLDDDVRLTAGSPCIDAGRFWPQTDYPDLDDDGDVDELLPLDLAGNLRRVDDPATPDTGTGSPPIIDMGCYEFGSIPPAELWSDLGNALAGTHGDPVLTGFGTLGGGALYGLDLTGTLENTTATLVLGVTELSAPLKGGVLVPFPHIIVAGLPTGPAGEISFEGPFPDLGVSGVGLYWQYWIADGGGVFGFAASNAVVGVTP